MHWRARSSVRTEHRTFKLASREIRGSRVQFPSGPPLQKQICTDSNRQLPSFSVLNYVVIPSAQIPFLECSPEYSDVTVKSRKGGTHRVETGRTLIREAVKKMVYLWEPAGFFSKYSLIMSPRAFVLLVKPSAVFISRNRPLICPFNISRISKTFSDVLSTQSYFLCLFCHMKLGSFGTCTLYIATI
jgi:hypothetical protein